MHTSQGNPFVIPTSITSKVDEIMSCAQARFGRDAFRMEEPPAGDPPASDPPATDPPASPPADPPKDAGKVEDLPDWAQKIIKDTRQEAAGNRTKATEAEQKQAKILEGIATALGIKKGDDAPTPEQLAQELTRAQSEGRGATVELAVFKAAIKGGADPIGLTDSRTFMTKVTDLDPAADDFATKVKAEIETAVKDNPKLKAGPASTSSSADHPGGPGEDGDPASRARPGQARIAAAYANS